MNHKASGENIDLLYLNTFQDFFSGLSFLEKK